MTIVRLVQSGACEIWGLCDENGDGGIFDFLRGLDAAYEPAKLGMREIFDRVAKQGLSNLPDAISHLVNREEKIFEFVKGDLRILYFKDGGRIVICTEGVVKHGQKADTKAVQRTITAKDKYFTSKADDSLIYVRERKVKP